MTYLVSGRARLGRVARFGLGAALAAAMFAGPACADPQTPPISPRTVDYGNALAGKIVFLDPGHQGYGTPELLHKQVSNGRGATKDCQTMGATSVHGVPEHTVNWRIAQNVKRQLESQGARVFLSRTNDTGWFGCITDRAEAANRSGADLALSIHADSSRAGVDTAHRGFHLIVPTLPIPNQTINQVQGSKGLLASRSVRDSMKAAGFPVSNYIATTDGLSSRFDVAAPALTKIPMVFVEAGNLANPQEASVLESAAGQKRYADAIVAGVSGYLRSSASTAPLGQGIPPSLPIPPQITGDTTSFVDYFTNLVSGLGGRNGTNTPVNGINPDGTINPSITTPTTNNGTLDAISQQLTNILSKYTQGANGAVNGITNPNGVNGYNPSGNITPNGTVNAAIMNNPLVSALRNVPGVGSLVESYTHGNVAPLANFLQSLVNPGNGVTTPVTR